MEVTPEQLINIIGSLTVEVNVLTKQRDALLARLNQLEVNRPSDPRALPSTEAGL